jgi:DNA-directed RNA polymerase specialized sigma24 family protein
LNARENVAVRTRDEIADAIRSLTPAQWARLGAVAEKFAYAMSADDLLQEAFTRALSEERRCPAHIDVVRFLAEVMRSIANGEYEKAKARPHLVPVASHGDQEDGAVDPLDPGISADDWLAREQDAAQRRKEILALFEDDAQARDIVEGRMAEMDADELRELTGLDAVGICQQA